MALVCRLAQRAACAGNEGRGRGGAFGKAWEGKRSFTTYAENTLQRFNSKPKSEKLAIISMMLSLTSSSQVKLEKTAPAVFGRETSAFLGRPQSRVKIGSFIALVALEIRRRQKKFFEKHKRELKFSFDKLEEQQRQKQQQMSNSISSSSSFDKLELEMKSKFAEEKRKWAQLRAEIAEHQLKTAVRDSWYLAKEPRAKGDVEL